MAVMTMSLKQPDIKTHSSDHKKPKKSLEKCRPITATLDHPLILDIKLLQKLDMTTFTKRGLIALSKFCGISLITKNGSRIKLNHCIKAIQGTKKQVAKSSRSSSGGGDDGNNAEVDTVRTSKEKREKEKDTEIEEDSDVICKNDTKVRTRKSIKSKHKTGKKTKENLSVKKKVVSERAYNAPIEVVPEPCKSCNRSQQPERLHSHPKHSVRGMMERKRLEERFKTPGKSKDVADGTNTQTSSEKANGKIKGSCAKGSTVIQKDLLSVPRGDQNNVSPTNNLKIRRNSSSSIKSVTSFELLDESDKKKTEIGTVKKAHSPSRVRTSSNSEEDSQIVSNKKNDRNVKNDQKSDEDALKYVTGCYICGAQVSPEARMQHEKDCIREWRSHNSVLDPENRKPEPKRPDYRFTVSGEVDFNGTFESIWANHMDSLVPCKSCGRKFFPDRIERHENCCNNLSLRIKFKH